MSLRLARDRPHTETDVWKIGVPLASYERSGRRAGVCDSQFPLDRGRWVTARTVPPCYFAFNSTPLLPRGPNGPLSRAALFCARAFCPYARSLTASAVRARLGLFPSDLVSQYPPSRKHRRREPDGHEHWRARPLQRVDPQTQRDRTVLRGRAGLQERSAPAIRFPRRLAL